jgi:tetratricopeptide (TPR) repeat protein
MEIMLLGGEFIFALVMMQFFLPDLNWSLHLEPQNIVLAFYIAYCVNYILVESLFVSMGFSLYINCRNETEGWDIQLLFQKFAQNSSRVAKAVVLCVGLFFIVLPLQAYVPADDYNSLQLAEGSEVQEEEREYFPPDFMPLEQVPMQSLEDIFSSNEFGGRTQAWQIVPKNRNEEVRKIPDIDLNPWLEKMNEYLAQALRAFIALVLIGFIVFALIRLRQLKRSVQAKKSGRKAYANSFVSDEKPETLFDRANDYFQRGLLREAWASCLCGAISAYNQYMEVTFPPDATEYNCLELVKSRFRQEDANSAEGFSDLVRNWVLLAYGERTPVDGSFEKALAFGRNIKASAIFLEAHNA